MTASFAAPRLLIGQYRILDDSNVDITLNIAGELAKALDQAGQVEPVVWSMTDPNFREMAIQNNIPEKLQFPHPDYVQELSQNIAFDYYLEIMAAKDATGTKPIVKLYQGRKNRPIWEFGTIRGRQFLPEVMYDGNVDTRRSREYMEKLNQNGQGLENMVVMVDGLPDWYSLSATLARTWAVLLEETAFDGLPRNPKIESPLLGSGYLISGTGISIESLPPPETITKVNSLISTGDTDLAIVLLREGIDTYPLEPSLRIKLSAILMDMDLYEQAAAEAERAARLGKDQSDLWLTAAKAWLFAQDVDKAQDALNQALARGEENLKSHALMGDVFLLQEDFDRAIRAYTKSIEHAPNPPAIIGRAMAYAMAGQPEACTKDLETLGDTDPEAYSEAYHQAVQLADRRFDSMAVQLKELIPSLRVSNNAPEFQAKATAIERSALALSELISNIPVPERYQKSHQARSLAHLLLSQSASEVSEYAKTGRSSYGDEALISLGEALKLMPGVRQAFRIEKTDSALPILQ